MPCGNCNTTHNLLPVPILDLSPDTMAVSERDYCMTCLKEEGFFCEAHQEVYMLVYDPNVTDDESFDEIEVMYACLSCNRERALAVSRAEFHQYEMLLREGRQSEVFLAGLQSLGEFLEDNELPPERRLIFGAMLMSDFFKTDLSETVTDLVVQAAGAVRN